MKIVTWNINGIRSLKQHVKGTLKDLGGDIVCFQETKISRSQLPEDIALIDGYSSYFSFPKWQSGYSGVATYCRDSCTPVKAEEGLCGNLDLGDKCTGIGNSTTLADVVNGLSFDLSSLDSEGRVVMTQHELQNGTGTVNLVVINVYCPRADPDKPERKIYKLQFCQLLEVRAQLLVQEGFQVVIIGDFNIAHQPIDHCDPCDEIEFKAHEARVWLTSLLDTEIHAENSTLEEDRNFVDAFRYLHPEQKGAYTCWNTLTGARKTNYGTRIDYILSSKTFLPFLTSCEILPDVFGSDHCPVIATFSCKPLPSSQLPSLCCRLWPEFAGQQQKLLGFLTKMDPTSKLNDETTSKRRNDVDSSSHKEKKTRRTNVTPKQKTITNFFTNMVTKINKSLNDKQVEECSTNKMPSNISNSENCNAKSINHTSKTDSDIISDEMKKPTCSENLAEGDNGNNVNLNSTQTQSEVWKRVLSGLPPPPLCKGHGKACVLRTVKKEGPNFGRQFFACSQPNGHISNPESCCNFFQWATSPKFSVLKKQQC